jgi:hypothetical protein
MNPEYERFAIEQTHIRIQSRVTGGARAAAVDVDLDPDARALTCECVVEVETGFDANVSNGDGVDENAGDEDGEDLTVRKDLAETAGDVVRG